MAKLELLERLVGEWTMEAGPPDADPWPGQARFSFNWLEGRTWLIQRWTVEMPEAPDGIAIIGLSDAPPDAQSAKGSGGGFRQHYFDSRGVQRVYEMSFEGDDWNLWRDGPPFDQRFSGQFVDDDTIRGRWEIREPNEAWRTDFEVTYRRI